MNVQLQLLPCLDSDERAQQRQRELAIPRDMAMRLGKTAVQAIDQGFFVNDAGEQIDWSDAVRDAIHGKLSIMPDAPLPDHEPVEFPETSVQVVNETTLGAGQRLVQRGLKPLALNFANGVVPGGGFLAGARAQEEVLCRSSALFRTLDGDPMYEVHRARPTPDSTDWAIVSPAVPVFRTDGGSALDTCWQMSFVTCAAPYAPQIGQPESGNLLNARIHRVLSIASALGYSTLVLGAWGCGAFGNDPQRTAQDFRDALENEFQRAFDHVIFAITDWSSERRFLGPFRDVFR